ncbi:MAG: chromosome segregation protein SMC [Planctomycetaceae bacterium]|nr:chromosome segregation protein SMC [Planctomycetaceae bacterium]
MLKALELTGFKSFADKTRFEFPEGITVVVGPNGSGKSNVVDAVKWVLGTTSAKSLRGKEMADVIFKSPNQSTRRDINSAEATIIFDNSARVLPLEQDEVRVTRRVYRSGEGEYMINDEPCRLKDIKNLIRGTGIGADAYSIIEQGKVARMLEASSKDRRQIFEEAAGISRFKAKKLETLRRLDRVDQNLLRLSDIVDEVEGRLKAVRNQATKARRYKEYSDRLQQLRTQIGLAQWRQLRESIRIYDDQIEEVETQSNELNLQLDQSTNTIAEFDSQLERLTGDLQGQDELSAAVREKIAEFVTTQTVQTQRLDELASEIARHRIQLSITQSGVGGIENRLSNTNTELDDSRSALKKTQQDLELVESRQQTLQSQFKQLQSDTERQRAEQVTATRKVSQAQADYNQLAAQVDNFTEQIESLETQLHSSQDILNSLQQTTAKHQHQEDELNAALTVAEEESENITREIAENRRVHNRRQQNLQALVERLTAVRERSNVLQELETRNAGVSEAVGQLLKSSHSHQEGTPRLGIIGLVADLLEVDFSSASLIDLALGKRAQMIVTEDDELLDSCRTGRTQLDSQITLVNLDDLGPYPLPLTLEDDPLVECRADQLIHCPGRLRPLFTMLLSDTWITQDLTSAQQLWQRYRGQIQIITKAGERLDHQGTITMGPPDSSSALISRRSELRNLKQDIFVLEAQVQDNRDEQHRLKQNIEEQEEQLESLKSLIESKRTAINQQQVELRSCQDRMNHEIQRCEQLDGDLGSIRNKQNSTAIKLEQQEIELNSLKQYLTEITGSLNRFNKAFHELERQNQSLNKQAVQLRITAGTGEQRVDALETQLLQYALDHEEKKTVVDDQVKLLEQAEYRHGHSTMQILSATTQLAELYLTKAQYRDTTVAIRQRQEEILTERKGESRSSDKIRKEIESLVARKHEIELASGELRSQRITLEERLREDYDLEISSLQDQQETEEETQQREEVEREIESLRRKINNIGAVNMEALGELNDLEERFNSLSDKFQDLTLAKQSLEKIIQRVDADSRRLFLETLETIRQNFQQLYRKAFGGGQADIILEEGVDILEAGVEIITSPLGKPAINISLLSGGEKALTAVSLLLAIFQFRPSPFCILDEVDAPFDEANIGRFINVLKDFLDFTRFIIVTHSKKTMTAADTLYGVTMQESGVSKQVSVRFEDVGINGEIHNDAVNRNAA